MNTIARRTSVAMLCVALVLVIDGCFGPSLSKTEAEKLLRDTFRLPLTQTGNFYTGKLIEFMFGNETNLPYYRELEKLGYVSVKPIDYPVGESTIPGFEVALTKKGRAVTVEAQEQGHEGSRPIKWVKLKLFKADVEVGTIRIQGATAEVDYRIRYSEIRDKALCNFFEPKIDTTKPGPWHTERAMFTNGKWKLSQ
ncbi:MAG: hypothetical protein ACYC1U_08110 [Candidatus Aquicultorales bacterium]